MKYKNYYKILELKSDRVSDEEIKSAYRKLAKKYHPDMNPGDDIASEKFKAVNEAYQILGDETSKKKYDRIHNVYRVKNTIEDTKELLNSNGISEMIGMVFGKKQDSSSDIKNKKTVGEDIETSIDITLKEAFLGVEKKLALKQANGKLKNIMVKIPRGIRSGSKIRVLGQGKSSINGGNYGDLYIRVQILPDEVFKLSDNDICMNLELSPWEAALGTKLEVTNLDTSILIDVPSGVQSNEILRVKNAGFWNEQGVIRGDLLLNIQIMVPKVLTDSERLLFEKLSLISHFEPRKNK